MQAGLAGYSDMAMRTVARRRGCPYAVTEALLDRMLLGGGLLLVVSGVYYPVSVLPQWMQWLATISPMDVPVRGSLLYGWMSSTSKLAHG